MGTFEEAYGDCIEKLGKVNLGERAERLGGTMENDALVIPFFSMPHSVSRKGVKDASGNTANLAVSVVLLTYILRCPETVPESTEWVSFRDFEGSAPLVNSFVNSTNKLITRTFAGKTAELEKAAARLGGGPVRGELSYDLSVGIPALPKVPLYIMFNDRDEEFPAQCVVLFERSAEQYLDLKSISVLGTFLKGNLVSGHGDV